MAARHTDIPRHSSIDERRANITRLCAEIQAEEDEGHRKQLTIELGFHIGWHKTTGRDAKYIRQLIGGVMDAFDLVHKLGKRRATASSPILRVVAGKRP